MAFKLAQTFYIDKSSVRDAEHVTLTSIDVFFKRKPLETANRSGIKQPGVTILMMETRDDDLPNTKAVLDTGSARIEYTSIIATADASIPATFSFTKPLIIKTNKSYAMAISYDGDEDFELWTCREGELIVGTNTTTGGATARNVGNFYEYASVVDSSYNPGTTLSDQWKALSNIDLKFTVKAAVYSSSIADNDIDTTYLLPSDPTEFIAYDRYNFRTTNRTAISTGEMVFQETPVAYGPVSVRTDSLSIVASGNVNFSTLVYPSATLTGGPADDKPYLAQKSYIVLRNGIGPSAPVNVREVVEVVSNTEIVVDKFPTFTNQSSTVSVTAAGRLTHHSLYWHTGRWWNGATMDVLSGRKVDMLRLVDTNANSSVRFTNNAVIGITINSGGTGYSNNDTIVVAPVLNANTNDPNHINYVPSYANATAKIVTNNAGTITGIAFTSAGYGLTALTTTTISTSNGVSANLVTEVGSYLRSETSNSTFANTVVSNVDVHRNFPHCHVLTNQHHTYRMFQHYPYYTKPGYEHLIQVSSPAVSREVDTFTNNDTLDLKTNDGRVYVLASRSNEVMQNNVVVQVSNTAIVNTAVQSSSIIEVAISSNNAFSLPMVVTDDVYNYKYIVNNTREGEKKGQGKALARHLSTKVTFADGRQAEDILVYIDAYRPAGTNIQAYARLYNKADPDSFDDKDWTQLELKSNNDVQYSSLTNDKDTVEYTFGLGNPVSVMTLTGDNVLDTSANVVGVGTSFTSDLKVNDVVKVYSPLFPRDYTINVVRSISNNTLVTLADPVGKTGGGYKLDLVGRPGTATQAEIGNPFQAFTYLNKQGVCRYFNSSMARFDTYSTFQIKLVLTSNNNAIVPKIENIRAVGVSA